MEDIEILIGIFSLIFCFIATLIGLLIASKYRKYKQNTLLYVGISMPGLSLPWYPSCISFLMALITGEGLPPQIYFLIGNAFIPVTLLLWILAFTEIILKKNKKIKKIIILIVYTVIGIIFEIFLFYTVFTDYNSIGELKGSVDVEYYGITRYYLMFTLLTLFISSLFGIIESIKSDNADIKLKGKFLLAGIILYTIGAIFDGFIPQTFVTLPIVRIILITSILMYYNGWILPKAVRNLFLKEK